MAYLVPDILMLLSSIRLQERQQKVRLPMGVKKEAENLFTRFWTIKPELADAEKRKWSDPDIQDWLMELNEVCYEMEDVLEEWNTEILRSEYEYAWIPKTKPVRSFSPCLCFGSGRRSLHWGPDDIVPKIKNLSERVYKLFKMKEWQQINFEKSIEQHVSASVIKEPGIIGREAEKQQLIEMLLRQDGGDAKPHVISMVGEGGIGKTTLAQFLYNDQRIIDHFNKRVWVLVSDPFDVMRVANEILYSLLGFAPTVNAFERVLREIASAISEMKFLLVLDDVPETEDFGLWERLMACLKCGLTGSKILVTARDMGVAHLMASPASIVNIDSMTADDNWLLFSWYAFFGRTNRERKNLEAIGKQLAEKCQDLPIAAVVLGSLLRFTKSRKGWLGILNNELWQLNVFQSPVLVALRVNYYDLPFNLRQCLAYCGVFPADYMFVKDELINLWMAQGYLRATQSKEMEMIGHEYFDSLAARGFFYNFIRDEHGSIVKCKMHVLAYQVALSVGGQECVYIEAHDAVSGSMAPYRKIRHLRIKDVKETTLSLLCYHERLRSLFIDSEGHNDSKSLTHLPDLLEKKTCLRTLKLSKLSISDVPVDIKNLIHLRCLDLSGNLGLKNLPDEICELHNLQTLELSGCADLEKLPHGIDKLVNLRCLRNQETRKLIFMPKRMARLSSLRMLDEFVVKGSSYNGEASTLGDLKNLNQLRKSLVIRGLGNEGDAREAKIAQLKNKMYLITLILNFDSVDAEGTNVHDKEVIQALDPPSGLATLEINGYRGITMSPTWMMSLTKLSKLCLSNFKRCRRLPLMGQLPCLESLQITFMNGLKKLGHEFFGIETYGTVKDDEEDEEISSPSSSSPSSSVIAFPKLKELIFLQLGKWKKWEDLCDGLKESTKIMPCIRFLQISDCPKLEALPIRLLQMSKVLKKLSISECPILNAHYYQMKKEDLQKISHILILEIDEQRQYGH